MTSPTRYESRIQRMRAFVNLSLGESYDDEAEGSVEVSELMARREAYPSGRLPDGVLVVTAGADVQADRIEVELVGWGLGEESWSLDYLVLAGDPTAAEVWRKFDAVLSRTYAHASGFRVPVGAAAIDSGYATQAVYAFCRERVSRNVFAVKGREGQVAVWPRKPSRKQGAQLFTVGVDAAKHTVAGRLRINEPGPGCCHFPSERPADWFEQLTSEHLVTTYSSGRPFRRWRRKPSVRNESLDCRVYSFAALQGLIALGVRLESEQQRLESFLPERRANQQRVSRSAFMGGWE